MLNGRLFDCHNLVVFLLPQRDRDLFSTCLLEDWTAYKPLKALGIASPVDFSYLTMVYKDMTEVEQRSIGRIAKVEFSRLALGAFLRNSRRCPESRLLLARLYKHCEGCGDLLRVLQRLIQFWFDLVILRLLTATGIEPSDMLLVIARVYDVNRND